MFIVSLAIADLIVGLFVMPVSTMYIFTEEWLFQIAVCQIWIGIDYTASTASILNLFILSVDRYWSVTNPLKYLRKRTKKRAVIMISIVWLVSSLWIIPIAGWHHFVNHGVRTVPPNECDTEYAKNSILKVITAILNFFLPVAVMYSLYWKIFQEIRKRSEMELGQRNEGRVKNCNSYIPANYSINESFSEQRLDNNSVQTDSMPTTHLPGDLSYYEVSSMKPHRNKKSGYINMWILNRRRKDDRGIPLNSDRRINLHKEKCKVEYVYDESVLDEETEKVERYFYEDIKPAHEPSNHNHKKPNNIIIQPNTTAPAENSASSPSTPLSSCSSSEERRIKVKEKENYSLISGLKRIRQAENILDSTVIAGCSKEHENNRNDRNVFVFRDERNRRVSSMFNLKHRIRNLRQSSALTKEIKAARQLGVIMGAFTLCFLPYFILFLVVAFCDGCIDQGLLLAMTWVGYLNSTLNPFLYPLCNANFRRKFRRMLGLRSDRGRHRKHMGDDRNSLATSRYD